MAASKPKLRELFSKAVECQGANQQAAYLDQACQGDVELRAQLDELLDAQREAGSFLQEPSAAPVATMEQPRVTESPGTVIGPYKLLQQIGEGGFGVVYMAEQTEPVRRKVALKILKPGMDTRQVVARFEAERQALALMDHPNIAKVFDAGHTGVRSQESGVRNQGAASLTPDPCLLTPGVGRPYFVMELVKGVPITEFCDQNHLTPRQRLELFIPICQAVQHAHQKGIIHRDLKPSNILVAPYDGKPVVKVIDFGVAKAVGQRLTERTCFTEFGAVIGTVEYMSPEQAELNNHDIDTRTDIYSLGVLLYELLTGTTPLERQRVKDKGMLEALRIIREEETRCPSARLSTVKDLPAISAQRQMEPVKLKKLVRGELDWIAMKALDKDRNRRYETANGLAMDVQRYLADEAVLAGPPSAWYRFGKFARRNKAALVTATAVALAAAVLVTSLVVIAAEQQARRTAQEVAVIAAVAQAESHLAE